MQRKTGICILRKWSAINRRRSDCAMSEEIWCVRLISHRWRSFVSRARAETQQWTSSTPTHAQPRHSSTINFANSFFSSARCSSPFLLQQIHYPDIMQSVQLRSNSELMTIPCVRRAATRFSRSCADFSPESIRRKKRASRIRHQTFFGEPGKEKVAERETERENEISYAQ